MLTVARAAAEREGLIVEWREGNAEQLPYSDNSFDLVRSQFALMLVDNKRAAFAEMRRVTAKNGRVLVSVWQGLDRHPFYEALHKIIQRCKTSLLLATQTTCTHWQLTLDFGRQT